MVVLLQQVTVLLEYLNLLLAVDILEPGGVSRVMFSSFWEEAYSRFFDGACLFTPNLHVTTHVSSALLGRYIPIRIAFPSLAVGLQLKFLHNSLLKPSLKVCFHMKQLLLKMH